MISDREILEELCPADPWSSSREGLDDYCLFCGSDQATYLASPGRPHWDRQMIFYHDVTCPWMKAMDYLKRDHPQHHLKEMEK